MSRVLIAIPRRHPAMDAGLGRLQAAGCELVINPHGRTLTGDELKAMLAGCFASVGTTGMSPYV